MMALLTRQSLPHILSRHALIWLLLSQAAIIVPHILRLPIWLPILLIGCAFYRWHILHRQLAIPSHTIRLFLVIITSVALFLSYDNFLSLEPMVSLLIVGQSLKLLEVKNLRDSYVLLLNGFMIVLSLFLFDQGIIITLYLLFALSVLVAAFVATHQVNQWYFTWQNYRKSAVLFFQAIPLMLVLFLVFPRFAPLWQMPVPGAQAKTGMSDTMSPGDIASLAQSAELAFRVEFESVPPSTDQLYWRGLILDSFDGRAWQQSKDVFAQKESISRHFLSKKVSQSNGTINYTVFLEPSYRSWVYSLAWPYSDNNDLLLAQGQTLESREPVYQRQQFVLKSTPLAIENTKSLNRSDYFKYTQISTNNPETKKFAKRLYAQSRSAQQFVNRLLDYFNQENFYYTLQPPTLGLHSIDEFLFSTQQGFCEHYSSAFTFMLRSVGVPARVVAGYQGGEFNPVNNSLLVRQYDAHAWVEVWFEGKGWVRVDPTSAVAPNRVSQGAMASQQQGETLAANNRFNPTLLSKVMMQYDALQFYWVKWVLNFDTGKQAGFLTKLLGSNDPIRIALFLLAVVILVAGWSLLSAIVGTKKTKSIELKLMDKLMAKLTKQGVELKSTDSFEKWKLVVLQSDIDSDKKLLVKSSIIEFQKLTYQSLNTEQKQQAIVTIKKQLAAL